MSEFRLLSLLLLLAATVLLLPVIDETHSANVDKVVVVMPKGPRTLQMLGSLSPQLLHTISDVLKPVPSNVVQIPVPYYPDSPRYPTSLTKHYPKKTVNEAYFRSPFAKYNLPQLTLDLKNTQPGPYDTPFVPMLKPSPVNPLHIESPPEIKFTPINLLPSEPPSFDTVRNYVQKLKAKQKVFFDSHGSDFGFSVAAPPPPAKKYSSFTKLYDYKKKHRYKYNKPNYDYLFASNHYHHPNELSHIGQANLHPQQEENVYYTEPDAGTNFYYANAEGHEFVIPPNGDFLPSVELQGIVDPDDAHFEQKGEDLVLKTKHPDAAILTPEELAVFSEAADEYGYGELTATKRKTDKRPVDKKKKPKPHHRNKRFKLNDRIGRASGDQDVEADFYDSDEGKKKDGELDFDDTQEDEVKAMQNFEPKKTYVQVRHSETNTKQKQKPEDEPKIKEKVTISKTNIVYSEQGKESEKFDHGAEESFGEFRSKSKKPKKHRSKRDLTAVEPAPTEPIAAASTISSSEDVPVSYEEHNSRENEVDYELWPESAVSQNDSETTWLPYAQALVFQNETDLFLLPIPEALVDPRHLQGDDLLNFLDEAIQNSTQYLPEEKEKKPVVISPEITRLNGEELIQYLDDAIKTSNQYLLGPGDAIELVTAPRLGKVPFSTLPPPKIDANHEIEIVTDIPRAEEYHSEVHRYTRNYELPDSPPEFEEVRFEQPFSTLLKRRREQDTPREDYEIEIEAQNPRELHGTELLRYLDEAIENTTYYIPPDYEAQQYEAAPYLNRAYQYVDVDTALKFAENVTNQLVDYLQARSNYKHNEVEPDHDEETVLISDGGFIPIRRADTASNNVQFTSTNKAEFVGVTKDAFKNNQQKPPNPGVVVYNDVIRHIKNHLSSSNSSKTKDRHTLMIAIPRSLGRNRTRSADRRQDVGFDSFPKARLIQLPIFDINQFYPTLNQGGGLSPSDIKHSLEKEAERFVTLSSGSDQTPNANIPLTKSHLHDDIGDAFRDTKFRSGSRNHGKGPRVASNNHYAVEEKTRDFPQPTYRKPGPPYSAIPAPPSNYKTKAARLNTASKGQRALHSHPQQQLYLPLKRPRVNKHNQRKIIPIRVPVVRKKVRTIKR